MARTSYLEISVQKRNKYLLVFRTWHLPTSLRVKEYSRSEPPLHAESVNKTRFEMETKKALETRRLYPTYPPTKRLPGEAPASKRNDTRRHLLDPLRILLVFWAQELACSSIHLSIRRSVYSMPKQAERGAVAVWSKLSTSL